MYKKKIKESLTYFMKMQSKIKVKLLQKMPKTCERTTIYIQSGKKEQIPP